MEQVAFGGTGLRVSRIGLGGYPFSGVNRARGWDPYSAAGRQTALATIHRALDLGITYIDTAPGYGDGHSERLIGEVMRTRRDACVLATKVGWKGLDREAVKASVRASLDRLQTRHVDVAQFHGGMYTEADYEHIMHGGPLEALRELRQGGEVGAIGLTAEEPWTARPFLASGAFEVVQLAYNLIYQSAALHALDDARRLGTGVVTMRTMTSGILQHMLGSLAPEWPQARDPYEVCLGFVLSDPRVHVALVGMRWPEEVERNVRWVEAFAPPLDVSAVPRLTAGIYGAEDAGAGGRRIATMPEDGPDAAAIRWDVLTIGHLSRNRSWGEADDRAYREPLCTSTLIRTPKHTIVVDPGLPPEEMARVLDRRAGIGPDAVDIVFLTHFHGDHRVGLAAFPDAVWSMPEAEIEHAKRQDAARGAERALLERIRPAGPSLVPGIAVIATPGHSAGHASLLFESEEARVAVAGDAAMTRDFFQRRDWYFNTVDPAAAVASIETIARVADIVVPGHDNAFVHRRTG